MRGGGAGGRGEQKEGAPGRWTAEEGSRALWTGRQEGGEGRRHQGRCGARVCRDRLGWAPSGRRAEAGRKDGRGLRRARGALLPAPHLLQPEASCAPPGPLATLTSSRLLSSHLLYWMLLSWGCILGATGLWREGQKGG